MHAKTLKMLSVKVGKLLRKKQKSLATAESCTGGLLGHLITETPGASEYYLGGVIAYSNQVKKSHLGIPEKMLRKDGAVSSPVARQMAENARRFFKADYALGITGIAGPGGGSKTKPAGLVYVALATKKRTRVVKNFFVGSRSSVKMQAAEKALSLLRQELF